MEDVKIEDTITSFKFAIYNFCLSFPGTPLVPGYTPSNRNTMLDLAESRRSTVSQYNNVVAKLFLNNKTPTQISLSHVFNILNTANNRKSMLYIVSIPR